MSVFCDSSALVKLYADETGSDAVRALAHRPLVSLLAGVEVPAALARKQRMGELGADHAHVLAREFAADFHGTPDEDPRFDVVAVNEEVVDVAAELTARYALRAYDAVPLAAALSAREALDGIDGFACFDAELRTAARAEGLAVLPA